MSNEDLQGRVRSWMAKTGLPLELEAKAAFKKVRFSVSHSTLYVDPESEKGREIDLVAFHQHTIGLVQVYFVVECKASGNPWVVLTDRSTFGGVANYSLGITSENVLSALPEGWRQQRSQLGGILGNLHRGGYALKQAFAGKDDDAYSAAISVLKASQAVVAKQLGKTQRYKVAIPVIVVDAPVFECDLDEKGEIQLTQVAYSEVHFTAYIPSYTVASIRIVSKKELPYFAKTCHALAREVIEQLDYKVQEWVQKKAENANRKS